MAQQSDNLSQVADIPAEIPATSPESRDRDRRPGGQFAPGNSLAKVGGTAKGTHIKLAANMGLNNHKLVEGFAKYRRSGTTFRKAQCAALAASVGGGLCGPGPSSLVASAALQLAWSRYLSDLAAECHGDHELVAELATKAARLADSSRQNLLAAHELCAREAQARQRGEPDLPLEDALRTPVR